MNIIVLCHCTDKIQDTWPPCPCEHFVKKQAHLCASGVHTLYRGLMAFILIAPLSRYDVMFQCMPVKIFSHPGHGYPRGVESRTTGCGLPMDHWYSMGARWIYLPWVPLQEVNKLKKVTSTALLDRQDKQIFKDLQEKSHQKLKIKSIYQFCILTKVGMQNFCG